MCSSKRMVFFFSITWYRLKFFFLPEMTLKQDGLAGPMRSEKQEFWGLSKTEKIGSDKDRGISDRSVWFKDCLNWYDYIASMVDEQMWMEHWRNNSDKGTPPYSKKFLPQSLCVHKKNAITDWTGIGSQASVVTDRRQRTWGMARQGHVFLWRTKPPSSHKTLSSRNLLFKPRCLSHCVMSSMAVLVTD